MKSYVTIFVNGEPFNCRNLMSLYDLLLYLNFNLSTIIVEYNKQIVTSSEFAYLLLHANDDIEIITIVGGG